MQGDTLVSRTCPFLRSRNSVQWSLSTLSPPPWIALPLPCRSLKSLLHPIPVLVLPHKGSPESCPLSPAGRPVPTLSSGPETKQPSVPNEQWSRGGTWGNQPYQALLKGVSIPPCPKLWVCTLARVRVCRWELGVLRWGRAAQRELQKWGRGWE